MTLDDRERSIVLFDGVCPLCDAVVRFVIARDPECRFRFAPLQSDIGRRLRRRCGVDPDALETLVLVEGSRCLTRSDAVLRIAAQLARPWPLAAALRWVPRPLRDAVYDWVARHRVRWFGRKPVCALPEGSPGDRFLAAPDSLAAPASAPPAAAKNPLGGPREGW